MIAGLELPLQAGGNADQRRPGKAVRVRRRSAGHVTGVVAVRCHAAAAGAEIVMRARSIDGRRNIAVPGQIRTQHALVGGGDHVGLVLIGGKNAISTIKGKRAVVVLAWIAGRMEGVSPAEVDAISRESCWLKNAQVPHRVRSF